MYNTLKKCIKLDFINLFTSCSLILAFRYLTVFDFADSILNKLEKIDLAKIQAKASDWKLPWDILNNIYDIIANTVNGISRFGDIISLILGGIVILVVVIIPMVIGIIALAFSNNKNKFIPDLLVSILFETVRIMIIIESAGIGITLIPLILEVNLGSIIIALLIYIIVLNIVYIIQIILILKHFKNRKKNLKEVIT